MTEPGVVRVLLADDDALVRAGLRMILGGHPDLEVVGEARDGVEAVALAGRLAVDVVLMDIRMPRRDGLSATEELLRTPSPPAVLVLTTFDTDDSVLTALRLGASGFLLKDTPPDRIVDAVRRVAAGEPALSPTVTAQLIAAVASGPQPDRTAAARTRLDSLTERERAVALAVGAGRSNAEIGAELYLSVATVKAHLSRVMVKLGVENRVQVAIQVHDAGLA
ncbi:DNA-binding NarL/FixJ family response regulator [Microlunatus capsulatus]|uniref:DNA-binding NarL/FixJ family response regulator n=1 Tax=Microlunatus capsulatus TaxID=99117 RepID=A0ABS4Z6D0_9ACTN|nr:DNA-binding NarL/FixJ family response regulator [Microlunatus capsulatus]